VGRFGGGVLAGEAQTRRTAQVSSDDVVVYYVREADNVGVASVNEKTRPVTQGFIIITSREGLTI